MTNNYQKNKIDINILIALVNILDEYEIFHERMMNYIKNNRYNKEQISKLEKISIDNNYLVGSKAKDFYLNNKETIDTINKYTSIYNFIVSNYNYRGYPFDDYNKLDYYYNYLLKNKNNIETIKELLDRIKELGFKEIDLDESYDFTKQDYYFLLDWYKHGDKKIYYSNLNYSENIEVLPNYEKNTIRYHSKSSNYRIMINEFSEEDESIFYREIMVNNLMFNPSLLPNKITKEETLDKIIKLKNANKREDEIIKDAIDLSINLEDLERQFIKTNKNINKIDSIINKEDLQKLLIEIYDNIQELREIENSYYQQIVKENNKITSENLNKEKKLLLDRRYDSIIDLL